MGIEFFPAFHRFCRTKFKGCWGGSPNEWGDVFSHCSGNTVCSTIGSGYRGTDPSRDYFSCCEAKAWKFVCDYYLKYFLWTHSYDGIQFISAMFAGVIIGYAIILTDNVYIGIIIHAVNNSFSFFNASVLNDKVWSMYSGNEFIQMAVGIIILIIGILMLRWEMGRGKRYG